MDRGGREALHGRRALLLGLCSREIPHLPIQPQTPWRNEGKTILQAMRKSQRSDGYPAVHSWSCITIEGYCMLNMEYRCCNDRYNYRLNPDRTFTRVKNDRYDPTMKPDPYPAGCKRSVRSSCIGCIHFGWCDPDEESTNKSTT